MDRGWDMFGVRANAQVRDNNYICEDMEIERIKTENRLATMEQKIDNLIEDVKEIGKDIKEKSKEMSCR